MGIMKFKKPKVNKRYLPPRLMGLTQRQADYLIDWNHRFFILPSGRRSRKTLLSKTKIICFKGLEKPDCNYFLAAPTYQQAKRIFWNDLKNWAHYFIKDKSESELCVTLVNNTKIHVIGLDKPERVEGTPWDGCLIDETGNVKEQAWRENIRPVLSDTNGFALLTGVPEGRNWYYDIALYAGGGFIPASYKTTGSFAENPNDKEWCYYHWFSSDVLSDHEIEAVKRELDERTYRQEYEGSFESYKGLAYWPFGKDNINPVEYNHVEHVHIGMDFNRNPMTATFSHVRNNRVYQFGEAYLNHSNTYEMRDHLLELFRVKNCTIYPDSTGKHESSNATMSDLGILTKAGFKIKARSINPRIKDRINAVNSKIMPANKVPCYFVDPSCKYTVNDLNKVQTTDDGREDKTQESTGLVHISSALGYMIAFLFPVKNLKARVING